MNLPWEQVIGDTYLFSSRITSDTFICKEFGLKVVTYRLLPDVIIRQEHDKREEYIPVPDNEYYWHSRKYKSVQELLMDYNNDRR